MIFRGKFTLLVVLIVFGLIILTALLYTTLFLRNSYTFHVINENPDFQISLSPLRTLNNATDFFQKTLEEEHIKVINIYITDIPQYINRVYTINGQTVQSIGVGIDKENEDTVAIKIFLDKAGLQQINKSPQDISFLIEENIFRAFTIMANNKKHITPDQLNEFALNNMSAGMQNSLGAFIVKIN